MQNFCSMEKWAIKKGLGEKCKVFKVSWGVVFTTQQWEGNRKLKILILSSSRKKSTWLSVGLLIHTFIHSPINKRRLTHYNSYSSTRGYKIFPWESHREGNTDQKKKKNQWYQCIIKSASRDTWELNYKWAEEGTSVILRAEDFKHFKEKEMQSRKGSRNCRRGRCSGKPAVGTGMSISWAWASEERGLIQAGTQDVQGQGAGSTMGQRPSQIQKLKGCENLSLPCK